jgi:crotonobetainyl-CoA:carnitine CoA-transferase CaiB-like acyl-CoA transferase
VRLQDTPTSLRHHPPRLGEHSDEILRAVGYGDNQIAELRASGVVT